MTRGGLDVRAMQRRITRTAEHPSQNARRRSAQSRPGQLRQAKNRRDSQRQAVAWVHGGRARRVSEHRKVHHREQTRTPGRRRTDDAGQPSKRDGRRGGASRQKRDVAGERCRGPKPQERRPVGRPPFRLAAVRSIAQNVRSRRNPPDRRSQLDPQCPRLIRNPETKCRRSRAGAPKRTPMTADDAAELTPDPSVAAAPDRPKNSRKPMGGAGGGPSQYGRKVHQARPPWRRKRTGATIARGR
jgi:hypothetical protein